MDTIWDTLGADLVPKRHTSMRGDLMLSDSGEPGKYVRCVTMQFRCIRSPLTTKLRAPSEQGHANTSESDLRFIQDSVSDSKMGERPGSSKVELGARCPSR